MRLGDTLFYTNTLVTVINQVSGCKVAISLDDTEDQLQERKLIETDISYAGWVTSNYLAHSNNTFWSGKGEVFTQHYLDKLKTLKELSKEIVLVEECDKIDDGVWYINKHGYSWSGPEEVDEPHDCFEYEICKFPITWSDSLKRWHFQLQRNWTGKAGTMNRSTDLYYFLPTTSTPTFQIKLNGPIRLTPLLNKIQWRVEWSTSPSDSWFKLFSQSRTKSLDIDGRWGPEGMLGLKFELLQTAIPPLYD